MEYSYIMSISKGKDQSTVYGTFQPVIGQSYTEHEIVDGIKANAKDFEDGVITYWNISSERIGYVTIDYSYILTYERNGVKSTASGVTQAKIGSSKHKLFETIKTMHSVTPEDTILYWHLEKDTI